MKHILLSMIAAMLLTACGGGEKQADEEAARESTEAQKARKEGAWCIAVMPTADCLPLWVASDRGFFEKERVKVLLQSYQSQMDVDTALQGRHAVAAVSDLVRTERLRQNGMKLRDVSATDAYWQLLTLRSARLRKLAQLDEKKVAMTRYSATDLLTDLVVDSVKLKNERVFRIQINDVDVRLGMLRTGIMDAMFLPEPYAMQARTLGSPLLLDSRKEDLRLGVIVFVEDSLKGRDKELQAFLKAYDMAVDSLNERGLVSYADVAQQRLGIGTATIEKLAKTLRYSHAAQPRQKDKERVDAWWKKRLESMKHVEKRYLQ